MLEFLRPIVILDTWLYICSGLFALFFLRLMWLARRDRLRREQGPRKAERRAQDRRRHRLNHFRPQA